VEVSLWSPPMVGLGDDPSLKSLGNSRDRTSRAMLSVDSSPHARVASASPPRPLGDLLTARSGFFALPDWLYTHSQAFGRRLRDEKRTHRRGTLDSRWRGVRRIRILPTLPAVLAVERFALPTDAPVFGALS
jgi:hypothetical protein